MRRSISLNLAALALALVAIPFAVKAAEPVAFFRVPIPALVAAAAPVTPPPIATDPDEGKPLRADVIKPRAYEAPGLSGEEHLAIIAGVINTLYDRTTAKSGANWPTSAAAGSQQLTLIFAQPVSADGCDVILNSRGTPAVSGVRFQYQDANGAWSAWTPDLGAFNTGVSGNKSFSGRCGIPEGGTLVKALRVSPVASFAGEIWYREFRVSLNGMSAQ